MSVVCLLTGCVEGSPSTSDSATEAASLAAHVQAAITDRDAQAFAALVDLAGNEEWLWSNIGALDVEVADAGSSRPDERIWHVSWSVPSEQSQAAHSVSVGTHCDKTCQVTSVNATPGEPLPLWLVAPIHVHTFDATPALHVITPAPGVEDPTPALTKITASPLAHLTWPTDDVVVEMPATTEQFERVIATDATDFAGSAALTWRADWAPGGTAMRVVTNPDTMPSGEQGIETLAHEFAHVGMEQRSHETSVVISEGVAQFVVGDPAAIPDARSLLTRKCHGYIPQAADYQSEETSALAYAWSLVAIADRADQPGGVEALNELLHEDDSRLDEIMPAECR